MNPSRLLLAAVLAIPLAATAAPGDDPATAYIDAGFAAMDFDNNGTVTKAEFERFMRERLARQARAFDASFAKLDANSDGTISKAEAAAHPLLAAHFTEVDANGDGQITKIELRTAMLQAQAREQAGE